MKYISLFAGIGCADVAWAPLGWEPLAFAEIDPFASAVLAHRFPGVPNVGDVTAHDWSQYRGRCDLVIGGSPCQAFSVAGLRHSLDDPRGQLTLAFVKACHAIHPAFIVWENAPSVTLTHDNAFGCFLAGLVGAAEPLRSDDKRGRWPDAGMVIGPERAAAWGFLDAQYFGVPQRRKRIFLVAVPLSHPAFAPGRTPNPAAVLFNPTGLFGDSPAGGEAGEEVVGTLASRATAGGGLGTDFDCSGGVQVVAEAEDGLPPVSGTLGGGSGNRGYPNSPDVCGVFVPMLSADVSGTVLARREIPDADDAKRGMLIPGRIAESGHGPGPVPAVTAKWAKGCGGPSGDEAQNLVVTGDGAVPIDLRNAQRDRRPNARAPGGGLAGREGDPAFTVTAGFGPQAVAFSSKNYGADEGEIAPTLRAMGHAHSHANGGGQIAVAIGRMGPTEIIPPLRASPGGTLRPEASGQVAIVQDVSTVAGEVTHTLRAEGADASEDGTGRGTPVVAVAMRGREGGAAVEEGGDTAFALRASQGGGDKAYVATRLAVRRLTPRECERLQGLPDDWTLIPHGKGRRLKDLADVAAYWGVQEAVARTLAADSLRYKAIGNGMAVPVIWWIGRRIEWVMEQLAAWDGRFGESEGD